MISFIKLIDQKLWSSGIYLYILSFEILYTGLILLCGFFFLTLLGTYKQFRPILNFEFAQTQLDIDTLSY